MHTLLLIDLGLRIHVESKNDHIGREVYATDEEEDIRVVKGNLLRQLHHHKDDGQISSAKIKAWSVYSTSAKEKELWKVDSMPKRSKEDNALRRLTLEDSFWQQGRLTRRSNMGRTGTETEGSRKEARAGRTFGQSADLEPQKVEQLSIRCEIT